jgi:phospholipase C
MTFPVILSFDSKNRIQNILNFISNNDHTDVDIIVLTEAFDNKSFRNIKKGLQKIGFTYTTGVIPKRHRFVPLNGGVVIFSKFEIKSHTTRAYKHACGLDVLSSKGFISATLNVNGKDLMIIATHLQADCTFCIFSKPENIRDKQLDQIRDYLDDLEDINIPVFVAGDLNIMQDSEEYNSASQKLGFLSYKAPEASSFSWENNEVAKKRYGTQWKCGTLDYVIPLRKSLKSEGEWFNKVLVPEGMCSDHHPVLGYLDISDNELASASFDI